MAAPVSEETRKMLERAQRAIDEARELREQRAAHMDECKAALFLLRLYMNREREKTYGTERK